MSTPPIPSSPRTSHRLRRTLCCAALFLFATSAFAQTPDAAPVDPGASILPPQPTGTYRVSVRRVVVDIVVSDASGKPVNGLPRDAFRITEDGKPQEIRTFDPHVSEAQPPLPAPQLPPNTFSNFSSAPQSGPVTVILYDLLNTPQESQAYAHDQLLRFLKERKASSQTAVFVLSDKLHLLQGFTDDENQLIAALNQQRGKGYKSSLLQAFGESSQQSDSLDKTDGSPVSATPTGDVSFAAVSTMLKHMESIESSAMLDRRVEITADALEQISRFLIGIPGRKNLLWLSGSFPTGILPDGDADRRDSFNVTRNYSETIIQASELLNLSHVAVYPVDVRGLQVNPMFSAFSNQTYAPGTGKDLKAVSDFSNQNAAEHATMDTMANETGGHAFYNTNGLKEAVTAAADDGSNYYTLTYSPTNKALDGGLRRIRVELTQPGYKLAYRRSYFADLDAKVSSIVDRPIEDAPNPLEVALTHGAPAARELFFEAHVQTYGAPVPATPAQLDVLAQYEARTRPTNRKKPSKPAPVTTSKTPVMMQRYLITYGLLLRQLTLLQTIDGAHRGNVEFAVMSYNDDGLALNGIRSTIADVIPQERYTHLLNEGYQVIQTVAVPVQSASLRLAVLDTASKRLGSTEIRLPLPPQPAAPAPTPTPAP